MIFDVLLLDILAFMEEVYVGSNSGRTVRVTTGIPKYPMEHVDIVQINMEEGRDGNKPFFLLPGLASLQLRLLDPADEAGGLAIAVGEQQPVWPQLIAQSIVVKCFMKAVNAVNRPFVLEYSAKL